MHLAGNLSDLLLSLWRATIDCAAADNPATWDWAVLKDEDTWIAHGEAVEKAGVYLPGSFDRKPRNIAEKLNTSYKTWEFQLYMFGLAPALLYGLLPMKYWQNYCKLVRGFQLLCQYRITVEDLQHAQSLLCYWEQEFEHLYYQHKEYRLHFVHPCIHQTNHLAQETVQKGPPICYAQWTMERTIGNLGQEIRQPSQPYANLSQQGVRRCRINTLLSMMPELDEPPKGLPEGAVDVGDGYVLLRKRERYPICPTGQHALAITAFLRHGQQLPRIRKWARLRLPNGQTARSSWREKLKPLEKTRMSRNVKIKLNNKIQFTEVLYYTQLPVNVAGQNADNSDDDNEWHFENVAVVQMYSMPHKELLKLSSQTLISCTLLDDILAIDVKNIVSVIAMVPHEPTLPSGVTESRFFMMEWPGLEISNLGVPYSGFDIGGGDELEDDDNDNGADLE
ncbi:hypothetical protein DFJ58DRAFT_671041 [Suillus subalutaceus]|uniref:uncharacterized protein n=1 Tax=Suillus subalutaceus TaxID=48586 RepID=UPI001B87E6AF|nr:uncharacterized protein DFJ58DRAFT_671041 [Suillus subalutaceus]KAG1832614.1 hypothetical protein DFJ58DRAFT_671041 [Suillus subalutaceus]